MTMVRRFIKGLTIDLSSSKNLVSMKSTLVGELSVLFWVVPLPVTKIVILNTNSEYTAEVVLI